ncbi:MAG: hypothetical protein AAF799_16485 [Myxococcota bacterium]
MPAHIQAAAWWDADSGPPVAELLPRAERLAADLSTRALAHVLGSLVERTADSLAELPWVVGVPVGSKIVLGPGSALRRIVAPGLAVGVVHAGAATLAMTLLEAMGLLADHDRVLVIFSQDATPPHNEASAAALLLARTPSAKNELRLEVPQLRRSALRARPELRPRPMLETAIALARAADVGRPTVETVPADAADRPEHWRIELHHAF